MPQRYFPINTETSCRLKWAWSTLYLNAGTTASCHRSSFSPIPENFEDFHNTSVKIRDREFMLQNFWPSGGCEYCQEIELAGGASDRQFQNKIPDIYPLELDTNNTLTSVIPTVLEVFFSNTCNLACVYCDAKYSSAIQAENKKFGGAILPELNFEYSDNRYKDLIPKFWDWFENNYKTLKRLQVLGGEPFLQREVLQLVDYFDKHPCPDLEFNLVTNLNLPVELLDPVLVKLQTLKQQNKLKRIDIQVSVDCWGSSQEYIRHGFKLERFEKNLLRMIELDAFRIGLLSTFTCLSIASLPNLALKYNEWCKKQKLFWYMHLVLPNNQSIFDPMMFDYSLYKESFDTVYKLLPNESWDDKETIKTFDGIVSKLQYNCKININMQQKLIQYLDTNDARRESNWRQEFPWLVKKVDDVV